jgi:hypothetical protein
MLLQVANHRKYYYEITDFIKLVGFIIEAYNNRLPHDQVKEKKILYATDYNDVVMDETTINSATLGTRPQNIVVYSIPRRENGTLGENQFGSPRDVRAKPREEIKVTNPDGTTKIVTIMGKYYDNIVRFECFAPSEDQVHDLTMRMENMLEVHAPWLEWLGINRILYGGRAIPGFNSRTLYHVHGFQMYVRTEHLWYREDTVINDVQLEVADIWQSYVQSINAPSGG